MADVPSPLGLFIQPACLQHKYIRHPNSSHIFERPERLRAVLLGVAAAVARLESDQEASVSGTERLSSGPIPSSSTGDDLSGLLSSLSIGSSSGHTLSTIHTKHLHIVAPPPTPSVPGTILLHHPAVQLAHSPVGEAPFPYLGATATSSSASVPASPYLKDLFKWASEAVDKIRETGCEIPTGLGLNQGDLYLGPGSILAIEGAIQTVCQAVDKVTRPFTPSSTPSTNETRGGPQTPPSQISHPSASYSTPPNPGSGPSSSSGFRKAFCAIRPPGHHCGEDAPSGFCYVNNVVVGAMHAYLQHDIDRAIIIDFDLHHGNGTQALVMPLNAASHAEDLMIEAGKPATMRGRNGKIRRGWKGFYGSVHDIYSYPCEDGDLDLIKDASISLAAHGQYIENIHLKPYKSEADFYARIYPLYLALLDKAKVYMEETGAEPSRTMVFISAGFDACEHEYQAMQRHDRRVPASFFSRYTKDIVDFANKYTEGKVVSVLEGGYSDRALTSAAMGHIVGMSGSLPEKCDEWWTEPELINLERATKKRRNGKLAPFPSELSSQPHLHRAHALLGHFEGSGPPDSAAPSVANTPQPGSRMTLRDRKKADEMNEMTPSARRGRRGGASATATPTRTKVSGAGTTATAALTQRSQTDTRVTPKRGASKEIKVDPDAGPDPVPDQPRLGQEGNDGLQEAMKGLAGVSLADGVEPAKSEPTADPEAAKPMAVQSSLGGSASSREPVPLQASKVIPNQQAAHSIPKIILRIPRPPSQSQAQPQPQHPTQSISTYDAPANSAQPAGNLYPALPRSPAAGDDQVQNIGPNLNLNMDVEGRSQSQLELKDEERLAYREASTSTEGESEYVSATSGSESAH